jgi:hypothetical protein
MLAKSPTLENNLVRFGFRFDRGGAHLARSMMLDDLRRLLEHVPDAQATRDEFARAILDENCLGKRSAQTRALSLRHLTNLYALDPHVPLFRALRYLWSRDADGQPLLACLVAYVRDAVLRMSAPPVLRMPPGQAMIPSELQSYLDAQSPGRFSPATLKSTAQNVATTWTHAGHLQGSAKKIRATAKPTPGAVALALLLGYMEGTRGELLFETTYTKLLDAAPERCMELAEQASSRGWIVCNRIGTVVEVRFPQLLTTQQQEAICE